MYDTGPIKYDERGWRTDGGCPAAYLAKHKLPRRHSVKYSLREQADVINQYLQGFSPSEIAEYHQRTEGGVLSLLRKRVAGIVAPVV